MTSITLPFKTERLILRSYRETDLDALVDIRSHREVVRYLYWDIQNRDEIAESLAKRLQMTSLDQEGDGMVLAVELPEIGRVIGDVSLRWVSEVDRQGDIGFVFHPDFHGRGFASEAAKIMLRIGFDDVGFHRIVGHCDARNTASAKLMERLGTRPEAHFIENEWFKGEWGSEFVYAILSNEWLASNSNPGGC